MIENILRKIAIFSEKKPFLMVMIILIITVLAGIEATNVKFQTAFEKMLPQNNPIIKTLYEVRDNFGGTDIIIICIKLKPSDSPDKVNDIRDPRVLRYIKFLEDDLKGIDGITDVSSPVDVIIKENNGTVPNDIETVKEIYNSLPENVRNKIFNYDYSMVIVNAYTDAGGDQKKLMEVMNDIHQRIEDSPVPPGVEVVCTGTPPMRKLLDDLMKKSQVFTTLIGGIGILIVLFLYFRKPLSTVMPLIPIVIAVIWTGGAMGILGIPVDMATAGIGSLLLGMGIDYGIHLMHRYEEERKKGRDVVESIETAVVSTGMAVMATTATTVVGFLALVIAPLPMMANLGKVCALGIAFCMICVITLLPALLVIEEKYIIPIFKRKKL
ncbi:MAG TPA: RND family transporter [Methanothermococcus okinawensis]|nr:RND family transporter [Methanothermococcus okinawensis]